MKRTKPLVQKSGNLERRIGLRVHSAKRRRLYTDRRKLAAAVLSDATCEAAELWWDVACEGPLQVHEPLTRARGGSITDPSNVRAVCAAHHAAIHALPDRAQKLGLLVHSWDAD